MCRQRRSVSLETSMKSSPERTDQLPTGGRLVGAVLAGLLAVSTSIVFAPAARADVKTITTNRSLEAWYWSSNQDVRACTPDELPSQIPGLCPSSNVNATRPISPGHLPVAVKAGQSDMRSYMMFDLSFIPLGSTLNSMVVTFTVSRSDASNQEHTTEHTANPLALADSQPKPPATVNDGAAAINACIVTVAWGQAEGAPPADRDPNDPTTLVPNEPEARKGVDKQTCVKGKNNVSTWTFDLTPLAKKWVSGAVFNNGFALLPVVAGAADTWTVELHGAYYSNAIQNPATGGTTQQVFVSHREEARAKLGYIPAALPPAPVVPPGGVALPPSAAGPPSIVSPSSPPEPIPVSTPGSTDQATLPLAQGRGSTPWYVWLLLPAGLLGLVTVSRALGREPEESGNRVAELLRERRTQTSGAP
jgi:hypothetical protein